IDRSFITTLATDTYNQIIASSIVDLAHNLSMTVVAEGIEDAETLSYVAGLRADTAQGFHTGRPMPSDHFLAWLPHRLPDRQDHDPATPDSTTASVTALSDFRYWSRGQLL